MRDFLSPWVKKSFKETLFIMNTLLELQKKIVPDLLEVMQKRYQVLHYIRLMQPIGRRTLADNLGMTERVLRSEVTLLKDQGLLDVASSGMQLTDEGSQLVIELEDIMKEVAGLRELEETLQKKLHINKIIVVPGDSDQNPSVKHDMGSACVVCMKKSILENNIVAVTGGTTLAAVADMMTPDMKGKNYLFVPARGGLGEHVENQANTICAKMAEKAKGEYRLLHVPEQVSRESYQTLIEEPSIKDLLKLIKSANLVIHGIGDALTMADRRKTTDHDVKKIIEGHAVGEAFGYYFDEQGKIVHNITTFGIRLQDLQESDNVIAIAGGTSKAKAIHAYTKLYEHTSVLITDEGAARHLLELP